STICHLRIERKLESRAYVFVNRRLKLPYSFGAQFFDRESGFCLPLVTFLQFIRIVLGESQVKCSCRFQLNVDARFILERRGEVRIHIATAAGEVKKLMRAIGF